MSSPPDVQAGFGLSTDEATRRLAEVGPNQLPRPRRPRLVGRFARQLVEPLSLLLLAAVVLSFVVLDERREAAAILAIVLLNAFFGAIQEHRADEAVEALKELTTPTARVRRDGHVVRIDAAHVVPGDVIELAAGDRVPADARLLDVHTFATDEAPLTGESLPVAKRADPGAPGGAVDDVAMAFAGTAAVRGRAVAEVVATGPLTELGQLATSLEAPAAVPLERDLHRLGGVLAALAGAVGVLLVPIAAMRGAGDGALANAVLAGVALTVAAIPEGLPAAVTASLALGAQRMARGGAIVRRLAAIESLGATSVLCVDKTGTLTTGHLAVQESHPLVGLDDEFWSAALRANDAPVGGDDPVDEAIEAAATDGVDIGTRVAERPFDAETGLMATVHEVHGASVLSVKGAPEAVLARCAAGPERDELHTQVLGLAGQGFKVLVVADAATSDPDATGLRPLGALALADTVRASASDAAQACRRAGIRVVMVTGDHPDTAVHVAEAVGLDTDRVVTGSELDELPPERRAEVLAAADVIARVRPATKVELVDAHRAAGHIVGMTGDGVNDAPALVRADAGVAIAGDAGTDVARQASDLVVTDGDLGTIVAAIRAGRRVYTNLGNVVAYLVAGNLAAIVVVGIGMVVIPEFAVPLLPVQILWVNFVTNGIPALALGIDEPLGDPLDGRPRDPGRPLLGRDTLAVLAIRATVIAGAVLSATLLVRSWGWTPAEQRTQLMTSLVMTEMALVYVTRARVLTLHRGWYRGRAVGYAVAGSLVATVLATMLPPLRSWLSLRPLPVEGWVVAIASVAVVVAVIDSARFLAARRKRASG